MRHFTKYRLDNGDEITARELADKIGITIHCARHRLYSYSNADAVYSPKGRHIHSPKRTKTVKGKNKINQFTPAERIYAKKPINDPMSVLWMRMA